MLLQSHFRHLHCSNHKDGFKQKTRQNERGKNPRKTDWATFNSVCLLGAHTSKRMFSKLFVVESHKHCLLVLTTKWQGTSQKDLFYPKSTPGAHKKYKKNKCQPKHSPESDTLHGVRHRCTQFIYCMSTSAAKVATERRDAVANVLRRSILQAPKSVKGSQAHTRVFLFEK